ncbi:hypothetical protein BN109_029 [Yersinia phage phi80-18]|uniref:Uncharacterized protein n=2 Tax=Pokrovskaiavirus TaxID=2732916 RepID=I7J425_9CAUD|nr:hypothetical protein BN109_029 [Yersinia phage phi80-18]YP_009788932.1 hypothetical protein HOR56_gp31 [Yersinia phage fHe-Yen3-01]APU00364.1 hypothetical protein fHeYen301_31 [Yersinia phage fHe-Yen3-01]CCI88868.2 hypothetical protein BN109_029 [Yersinia phage phi80-18]
MNNVINLGPHVRVFSAAELGDYIARGTYRQVGSIRTEYVNVATKNVARSVEAVIFDRPLNKLYAVEQHRGIAIRAEILDEEMRQAMLDMIPNLEEGEGFTYDQRITEGTEEIDALNDDLVKAEVNTGTEGLPLLPAPTEGA